MPTPTPTTTPVSANDVSAITVVKQNIFPDLIYNMTGATSDDLTRLQIDIIHNIENEDVRFVYVARDAVARAYSPDKPVRADLGKAYERVLKIRNVISGVPENIQNYRESPPFSILGVSDQGVAASDIIAKNLRTQTIAFGNQVISGAFGAKYQPTVDSPLNMYDGYDVKIEEDKEKGIIAATMGNYVTIPASTYADQLNPTEEECIAAYNRYISFVRQMNKHLRKVALVYCSVEEGRNIIAGYAFKFKHAQQIILNAPTFVSHEAKTVQLIETDLIGAFSTRLIATRAKNFQFATDLTRTDDPTKAFISIDKDPQDPLNKVLTSMQIGAGTRILDFNRQALCISDGTVEQVEFENDGVFRYGQEANAEGGTSSIDLSALAQTPEFQALLQAGIEAALAERG